MWRRTWVRTPKLDCGVGQLALTGSDTLAPPHPPSTNSAADASRARQTITSSMIGRRRPNVNAVPAQATYPHIRPSLCPLFGIGETPVMAELYPPIEPYDDGMLAVGD